jgi:hypothetical protein
MKSTHPTIPAAPMPAHLCQIRADVRAVLTEMQAAFAHEDAKLEAAILAAARDARISSRVPALCTAVMAMPGMSRRAAFHAVALQTGFHVKYVQQLFYGRSK